MIRILFSFFLLAVSFLAKAQTDTLFVYGPGGPYPAMKIAAEEFEKTSNSKIVIIKGPFKTWESQAKLNADLIYSGSEDMMTNFIKAFGDKLIVNSTVYPLFFRKSGLVVRKGNPKDIRKVTDLTRPGLNVMVVNGSGLIGVWEDMLSKLKINDFRKIRSNIKIFAENSGIAEKMWISDPTIDVWITWNIWQRRNPDTSAFIELPDPYTVYRDMGISLTTKGEAKKAATQFYEYLKSNKAAMIFHKAGWN